MFERRTGIDEGWTGAAPTNERPGIMRREELTGERDIGDIGAVRMNPLVKSKRGAAKREALNRAGG